MKWRRWGFALIPVAGVGTRLRPLTHTVPKVLIKVAGKPILGYILDELVRVGVNEMVLIVGYLADRVKEFVKTNYKDIKVDFIDLHGSFFAQPMHDLIVNHLFRRTRHGGVGRLGHKHSPYS